MLVSSIQPWQKTPRVGAAQLRDSPENCVRAASAKSGMKREMGHQMGRHILHTVAATEVDTRQRTHNLAVLIAEGCAPKSQDFSITGPTKKLLSHMKYSSNMSDFLRFYAYLCHVIDDFCLS